MAGEKFKIADAYKGESMAPSGEDKEKKNLSINIRQIKNGWIVSKSWEEDCEDECGTKYQYEEWYSAENPVESASENKED